MSKPWILIVVFITFLVSICQLNADDAKTVEVKARDLVLNVPSSWKQEQPKSRLRLTQFRIPAKEGDKEGAELVVFNFAGGGNVSQNIQRWISQFQPKERKTHIASGESKQGKYILVELSGTYKKPDGPPFQQKTVDVAGQRMLAVILVVKEKGVYFLKLIGPDATVASQAVAFRASFGGDKASEKKYETEE